MPHSDKDREPSLYCADCNSEFAGPDVLERASIGRSFRCPLNSSHLAAVVGGATGKRWLRLRRALLRYEHNYSLAAWLRRASGYFPDAGPYLALRFGFVIVGLLLALCEAPIWRSVGSLISLYVVCDIVIIHLAIAFVSQSPVDPFRSVVFALLSFLQLAIGFAVFYAALEPSFTCDGCSGPFRVDWINAVYFSWLIMTTVGWAEVVPHSRAILLKAIVALEIFISLTFLVAIIQILVGWSSTHGKHSSKLSEAVRQKHACAQPPD